MTQVTAFETDFWKDANLRKVWDEIVPGEPRTTIPYTLTVILPTNKRLLDPRLDPRTAEAASLLARWGHLHAGRTAAGAIAFLLLGLHTLGML